MNQRPQGATGVWQPPLRAVVGAALVALVAAAMAGVAMAVLVAVAPSAGSQVARTFSIVRYQVPVSGPVIDPFRPPAHIGAPGNRGLEFANELWEHVFAAADGVVSFAGMVAGNGVVAISHADGVKTTYTGMTTVSAIEGATILRGESLGTAGMNIHFGALVGDHYLDPQILIDESAGDTRVALVPTE